MRVKTLKDINDVSSRQLIKKGETFEVRILNTANLINPNAWVYQIIEGKYSGARLSPEFCLEIENSRTFTEKEWDGLVKSYMGDIEREREEKKRAQQMVHELTAQINNKNKEIEKLNFFLNCSNLALVASCQAIETLRENKAN